ncbi:uncharacterized protein NPIL_532381 [Nephila pilipes]|uniref:Uncharacterized protein n=1 Tax=Nephila pilipes TaxID=299642 RepID=A0A8X6QDE6_NEPPI|nr:uncharacterized protein NPIL_532381 [Nephila pilipes]
MRALTLGYPGANYKKEKVGLKLVEVEGRKQPIIVVDPSLKACRLKKVHPVYVEYRVLSVNKKFPSSLVEISTSSVKSYFVRIYASSQISSILGDLFYSNRMNTLMGVPVKLHVQHAQAYDIPLLPDKTAELLNLPKGSDISAIPTMLHLRSIFLPSFKGEDVIITADIPMHFKWTTEKLNLLSSNTVK